ncbi:AsmA-like C-terminal region-containing protein, partial [Maricaulis sp.]|uniref:AsmA-like C-terminal region-containing protein n=1 Tax=Maricaulis sp. TaxID=1486257 RepID=UPI003A95CC66
GAAEDGGVRELRLEAQSVGRIAALLGVEGYARDGRVSVLGEAPPLGTDGPLTARVEIRDLTLVQVPILARILAAGSFEGLSALLNGEGIEFDAIDASVMFEDGLLTIGEARARGSALGVTASGTVDFANKSAAIDGNLAPSYVLNSFLGELPLIGDMLVSRPGEGIIGIVYSVEGPFDSLTVFANPLSALAPGFLRRIFEGSAAARAAREREEAQGGALPDILPDSVLREFIPAREAASEPEPEPEAGPETGPEAEAVPQAEPDPG